LTNWRAFFKLGVAKQIWIRRRMLLPDVLPLFQNLQLAGYRVAAFCFAPLTAHYEALLGTITRIKELIEKKIFYAMRAGERLGPLLLDDLKR